jgi:hypothetical protein
MSKWSKIVVGRFINVGTPLVLMGAMWLYLWVLPWRVWYIDDPRWGHNYAEALAFLAVGLAYFNRRLVSDVLALLASLLIIPASLEIVPPPVTGIAGAMLAILIIIDMLVERRRETDLGQPSNRRLGFWLKGHILRFAYVMLGHLALVYFVVRLPYGTYEQELVTKVYDGLLIPLTILALLEGAVKSLWGLSTARLGFFLGMSSIVVSLIILFDQPETWICLAIAVVVSVLATVALLVDRRAGTV